jgi:predicted HTH domain antitoxin
MAVLNVPDNVLTETGLTERELLVELACRLFDTGKLSLWLAARMAGLDRNGMEDALLQRGIAVYRPTLDDLAKDLETINRLGG